MIVPSGYGSFPSRYALIATSLPRIAAKLCRVPSSCATDTNLQSRYPGGILIPKIGTASPPPCPDAGAVNTKIPPPVATAISKKAVHFIGLSLRRYVLASHDRPCPGACYHRVASPNNAAEIASSESKPAFENGVGLVLCLINAVVSMGRCNTMLEVYLAEFKGQVRSRASIQRRPGPY